MALPSAGQSDPARVASGVLDAVGVPASPDMHFRAAGRFNLTTTASAFVGTYRLIRSFDAGATWAPCTRGGSPVVFSGAVSEVIDEPEGHILYAIEVLTLTGGTLSFRFSQ